MTAGSSYLTHAPHLATDPAAIMVVTADWAAAVIGVSAGGGGLEQERSLSLRTCILSRLVFLHSYLPLPLACVRRP